MLRAAPGLRWPELRARHVAQLQRLNALGLTGAHVMDGEPQTLELLRDLEGTDELTLRLRVPLWQSPHVTDEEMEAQIALRDVCGKLWRGGVVKFFADGVIDSGTAWLEAPDTSERRATLEKGLDWLCSTPLPKRTADWDVDNSWSALYGFDCFARAALDTRFAAEPWKATGFPVEFFALGGQGVGTPLRVTMSAFGPTLLSKVLGLNDTALTVTVG